MGLICVWCDERPSVLCPRERPVCVECYDRELEQQMWEDLELESDPEILDAMMKHP